MSEIKELYEKLIPGRLRVFLGDKGLTMAEANHQANMVKELMANVASKFNRTNGYKSTVLLHDQEVALNNYTAIEDLKEEALKEGNYFGYSAWLREGISAKDAALILTKSIPVQKFGLESPEFTLVTPRMAVIDNTLFTQEDILDSWTVKERQEYLSVEAQAAHLGKKLHEAQGLGNVKGKIRLIREQMQNFTGSGLMEYALGGATKTTCIVKHTPLYDPTDIERIFLSLQEQHRSYEAKLNYYKSRLKDDLATANIERSNTNRQAHIEAAASYQEEMNVYSTSYKTWLDTNTAIEQARETLRLQLTQYISKLKIIIPEGLEIVSNELAATLKQD